MKACKHLLRPCLALCLLAPAAATAHFFTQPYTLPVPFSMYAFGASAALLLSFLVVGLFAGTPRAVLPIGHPTHRNEATAGTIRNHWVQAGRAVALLLLGVCIVAGFVGTQSPLGNISMTLFWIAFVLGLPYAVSLIGDFYGPLNPWRTVAEGLLRLAGAKLDGRFAYPSWLGYTPALVLYMAFIWLELFGQLRPRGLSAALLAYSAIQCLGAYLFGVRAWFRHGEFFGVLLRLLGKMSPWARPWGGAAAQDRRGVERRWRMPFSGLLDEPVAHISLTLFILFMLSSTAFDGLHSTAPWAALFWKTIYPQIAPWVPTAPGKVYAVSAQIYYAWQWISLLLSPLLYLAVFFAFIGLAKRLTSSSLSTWELALRFTTTLVPIAFVYHVTHYYTLLLAQVGQLVRLASDPFNQGWDLFGTAKRTIEPLVLEVDTIWHTQVALIVVGHIVSVYLAHVVALQTFGTARRAMVSQLPILVLMMLFTTLGLWILSMPLAAGG